ncbi:MAG: hypothetical protein RLZZ28_635 [Bacteroidota bacterium]
MLIAITAVFHKEDHPADYALFVKETFSRIALAHPEHTFIFLTDKTGNTQYSLINNIAEHYVKAPASNKITTTYWYDVKTPAILKRLKADLWIQANGIISHTTRIPQMVFSPDLKNPKRFFTSKKMDGLEAIITTGDGQETAINNRFPAFKGKILTIQMPADTVFQPADWQLKERIKDGNTDGREYFFYAGGTANESNAIMLLKAFSLFKKWQQSNMKLLIADKSVHKNSSFLEKLQSYKYREDVVIIKRPKKQFFAQLMASAYAFIELGVEDKFAPTIYAAFQTETALIAAEAGLVPELAGKAALYINERDQDMLAQHMLSLYKNEIQKSVLIEEGKKMLSGISWDRTAARIGQLLDEFTQK